VTDDLRQQHPELWGEVSSLVVHDLGIRSASTVDRIVALLLAAHGAEMARLREERDQALAHDRQPYPTQWAYDQTCAALETQRQRAEQAEAANNRAAALIRRHFLPHPDAEPSPDVAEILAALDGEETTDG
jgi:uncharacterized membrane protein YccC